MSILPFTEKKLRKQNWNLLNWTRIGIHIKMKRIRHTDIQYWLYDAFITQTFKV